MQADGGLPGSGAALDHERPVGCVRDQAVLVCLDRRDDVAHAGLATAVELLEEEVADARAVERGAVERLVGDVGQPAAGGAEAPAQGDALRIDRSGRVEGARRRRLPVDDKLPPLGVLAPSGDRRRAAARRRRSRGGRRGDRAPRPRRWRVALRSTPRARARRPPGRSRSPPAPRRRASRRARRRRGRRRPARRVGRGGATEPRVRGARVRHPVLPKVSSNARRLVFIAHKHFDCVRPAGAGRSLCSLRTSCSLRARFRAPAAGRG